MIRVIFIIIMSAAVASTIIGCTLTTTLLVDEEDHDVKLVNKSGQKVKVKLDDGAYHYLEDGDVIYVSAKEGDHRIEWEDYSRSRTRPKQVFKFTIHADIDIEFHEEPGSGVIIIDI